MLYKLLLYCKQMWLSNKIKGFSYKVGVVDVDDLAVYLHGHNANCVVILSTYVASKYSGMNFSNIIICITKCLSITLQCYVV